MPPFPRISSAAPSSSYLVVYQRCCLLETYANIFASGVTGLSIFVTLSPEARQLKNSAPLWPDGTPLFIACAHTPHLTDLAATDIDGDSLVYSLCTPFAGGGPIAIGGASLGCDGALPAPPCAPPYYPVQFVDPGYAPEEPLGLLSSSDFDIQGHWQFIPEYLGSFLYAVCVREYRDGVLLGETQRVLTLFVADGNSAAADVQKKRSILTCSPNPAGAELRVSLADFAGEKVRLTVQNPAGIVIFSKNFPDVETAVLPTSDWPRGLYFLRAESSGRVAAGRFVKE